MRRRSMSGKSTRVGVGQSGSADATSWTRVRVGRNVKPGFPRTELTSARIKRRRCAEEEGVSMQRRLAHLARGAPRPFPARQPFSPPHYGKTPRYRQRSDTLRHLIVLVHRGVLRRRLLSVLVLARRAIKVDAVEARDRRGRTSLRGDGFTAFRRRLVRRGRRAALDWQGRGGRCGGGRRSERGRERRRRRSPHAAHVPADPEGRAGEARDEDDDDESEGGGDDDEGIKARADVVVRHAAASVGTTVSEICRGSDEEHTYEQPETPSLPSCTAAAVERRVLPAASVILRRTTLPEGTLTAHRATPLVE